MFLSVSLIYLSCLSTSLSVCLWASVSLPVGFSVTCPQGPAFSASRFVSQVPSLGLESQPSSGRCGLCSELGCGDGLLALPGPHVDAGGPATKAGEAWPLPPVWKSPRTQTFPASADARDQQWEINLLSLPPICTAGLYPMMDRRPLEGAAEPSGALLSLRALLASDRAGGPRFIHCTQVPKGRKI